VEFEFDVIGGAELHVFTVSSAMPKRGRGAAAAAAAKKAPAAAKKAKARAPPKKPSAKATKAKAKLAPPDTTACEDDEAVVAFNEAVANEDEAAQRSAAVATLAAGSKAEYLAQVVKDVQTVVANIERGDCPFVLEKAWVWCCHDDWRQPEGIQVLVQDDQMAMIMSMEGTEDALTLRYIGEEGALHDAAKQLGIDISNTRLRISAAAIERAVDIVVDEGRPHGDEAWIVPKDAARLKRKFVTWMQGATWGQT
jgi:hypothetical protein